MSLWQIAAKNVWQSRSRYLAYLGSAAFAVMIFFLYTALQLHPMATSGGYRGAAYVTMGLKGTTVVIAIFTFLFLLYSNSAFVRSRMKEFGLFTLLGLSRGQLAGLIVAESLLIGAVATAAGIGAALLFEKLFFMAISALLRLPEQIPFYAGLPVWRNTAGLFGGSFVLVSLASLRSVLRSNIIGLVRAGRQPKGVPTFSRRKAIVGLVLLLGGYAWACVPHPAAVFLGVLPVTTMVSVGTYLLMREGSIAFLTWLHRREQFFYRPSSFLHVSQLVYKMQDNYRVLSGVAILVAVILTAVGTAATLYVVATGDAAHTDPHAMQVLRAGQSPQADVAQVEAVLAQHKVTGLTRQALTARAVTDERGTGALLVPYSFYVSVARPDGELLPLTGTDDAIEVMHGFVAKWYREPVVVSAKRFNIDGKELSLQVRKDYSGRITNAAGPNVSALVVSDARFALLMAETPAERQVHYVFWDGPTWGSRNMRQAADELRRSFGDELPTLTTRVEVYQRTVSTMGMVLFIGVFISLVFFAATFSLLYFRLFTEIDEDRKYFRRLEQLGVTTPELKGLALRQAGVIFLVPFAVGLVHSTFAMQALGRLTARTVLQYGWAMAAGYLLLYGAGFALAYRGYWQALRVGLSAREG